MDTLAQLIGQAESAVRRLTPRQVQVLRGVVQGGSSKQIARDLRLSPQTVEILAAEMMAKLGAKTVADAVRTAIYAGVGERRHGHSTEAV